MFRDIIIGRFVSTVLVMVTLKPLQQDGSINIVVVRSRVRPVDLAIKLGNAM